MSKSEQKLSPELDGDVLTTNLRIRRSLAKALPGILSSLELVNKAAEVKSDNKDVVPLVTPAELSVLFTGMTKAGKSTIINRLLGAETLPVGQACCTARMTNIDGCKDQDDELIEILEGERTESTVVLPPRNPERRELLSKVINLGSTERAKADSVSKTIRLRVKSAFLQKGLRVVDSPGFGENKALNDFVGAMVQGTHLFAVVFVLNASNNLPDSEKELIRNFKTNWAHVPVFIAVNHLDTADLATESGEEELSEDASEEEVLALRRKRRAYKLQLIYNRLRDVLPNDSVFNAQFKNDVYADCPFFGGVSTAQAKNRDQLAVQEWNTLVSKLNAYLNYFVKDCNRRVFDQMTPRVTLDLDLLMGSHVTIRKLRERNQRMDEVIKTMSARKEIILAESRERVTDALQTAIADRRIAWIDQVENREIVLEEGSRQSATAAYVIHGFLAEELRTCISGVVYGEFIHVAREFGVGLIEAVQELEMKQFSTEFAADSGIEEATRFSQKAAVNLGVGGYAAVGFAAATEAASGLAVAEALGVAGTLAGVADASIVLGGAMLATGGVAAIALTGLATVWAIQHFSSAVQRGQNVTEVLSDWWNGAQISRAWKRRKAEDILDSCAGYNLTSIVANAMKQFEAYLIRSEEHLHEEVQRIEVKLVSAERIRSASAQLSSQMLVAYAQLVALQDMQDMERLPEFGDIMSGRLRTMTYKGKPMVAKCFTAVDDQRLRMQLVELCVTRRSDLTHSNLLKSQIVVLPSLLGTDDVFSGNSTSKIKKMLDKGFFIMEKYDGSLSTLFDRETPLSAEELMRGLGLVARGISYLHIKGICHRDVKPDNILVRFDKEGALSKVVVADFDVSSLTPDAGTGAGTVLYMSPEVLKCDAYDASAADVWSWGVMAWMAVSRQKWIKYSTPQELRLLILRGGKPDVSHPAIAAIDGLSSLLARCFVPERERVKMEEVLKLLVDINKKLKKASKKASKNSRKVTVTALQ